MRIRLSPATIIDFKAKTVLDDGLRIFVCGESGSGKSSTAALITAQVIDCGAQVIVLDPHGEFGNLWDVNPSNVTRIGYGATPVAQEEVTEYIKIVQGGKSLLLDLSHWVLEPTELDTFVLSFVKALYRLRITEPKFTLLVVEESQIFIPQMQAAGQADNVRIFIGVMTGGRKWGLQTMLLTQRASLVDSNAVASCNIRIFLRTSEVRDYKRVRLYIPDSMGITYDDMKNLDSGEAIVLSRWTPDARVHLLEPPIKLRRAEL